MLDSDIVVLLSDAEKNLTRLEAVIPSTCPVGDLTRVVEDYHTGEKKTEVYDDDDDTDRENYVTELKAARNRVSAMRAATTPVDSIEFHNAITQLIDAVGLSGEWADSWGY